MTKTTSAMKFSSALILLLLLISACQQTPPQSDVVTPSDTPSTGTPTTAPTLSPTNAPTLTLSPTADPTSTLSFTPNATQRWDDTTMGQTPLPPHSHRISTETLQYLQEVAVWGNGRATDIDFSPNGQQLAVGTEVGVFLYDSTTYDLLAILKTPFSVQSLTYSPDNQVIAAGLVRDTVEVFELDGYSRIASLSLNTCNLPGDDQSIVRFSPDGQQITSIALTTERICINQWDGFTWQLISAFSRTRGEAFFVNENTNLIGIIAGNELLLQSLTFPEESRTITLPDIDPSDFWQQFTLNNGEILPSSDGNFLIINNGASIVRWEINEVKATYTLDDYPEVLNDSCRDAPETCLTPGREFAWECPNQTPASPIESIAMTPDNVMLLISLKVGKSEFRRASDGLLAWEVETGFKKTVFSPGSEFFFGLTEDGTIEKRTFTDGGLVDYLDQHPTYLHTLDFSPDGSILAAGFSDGWIRIISTSDGEMLGVLDGIARTLDFSPDGKCLAAGLEDGTIRIFQLEEGRFYDLPVGHLAAVSDLAFSEDGLHLFSGSLDCTASLWHLSDRDRIETLKPRREAPFRINRIALSDDTRMKYISGPWDGLYLFDNHDIDATQITDLESLADFTLSPDNKFLAGTGAFTWLIDQASEPPLLIPLSLDQDAEGRAVSFTPDGHLLVVASLEKLTFYAIPDAIRLSERLFHQPLREDSQPAEVTISPDGTLIAVGCQDGLIHIFSILPRP